MYQLEVIEGPDLGKKMELQKDGVLIGRSQTVRFQLSDSKTSRMHARVALGMDGQVTLTDENSSNGVILRNRKIAAAVPQPLFPGESFRLGDTVIRLKELDAARKMESIHKNADSGISYNLSAAGDYSPTGFYTRALNIGTQSITIGRDPSNNLVLDHPMVSRFHARIDMQAGKHIIHDLGSVNGTYVNGQQIIKSAPLIPDSLVQICGFRYVFDGSKLLEFNDNAGQIRIDIQHLGKTVKMPSGETRKLLDDINIVIEPREFVAILGGSGAGKSTLMGALTGMRQATSGDIFVNGRNLYKEYNVFRSMIGYVPQDDIVHQDLTVEEVLTFSARLRMPEDSFPSEIKSRVETVMNDLELSSRRDVLVKQLSGGQRKRVSIGVELLTSPSMFFLDEPTSGLDPGLEKTMMEMMRRLANQGRTIILVTHATFNISMCDKVIFLTEGGRLAFFGSPAEALTYFDAADFAEIYKKIGSDKTPEQWAMQYQASAINHRYRKNANLNTPRRINSHNNDMGDLAAPKNNSSSFRQWRILTHRYARIMMHDRKNLGLLFMQPIIIAILMIIVFINTAPTYEKSNLKPEDVGIGINVQVPNPANPENIANPDMNKDAGKDIKKNADKEIKRRNNMSMSVAMMIFTAIWLGTSNAIREIIKELAIYKRERLVNLKVGPYLLSKIFILSFICLLQSLIMVSMITISLGLPHFIPSVAAFFLVSMASLMMGLTVSSAVSNTDKAMSLAPVLLVPQIILSGALVPVASIKSVIFQKIFYLAISKWGFELVGGGIVDINNRVTTEGKLTAFEGSFTAHWWILAGFVAAFYVWSAVNLLRKDKEEA